MRERTPFTRTLFERLTNLKVLITTGARNASFDMAAAHERGVVVCGTRGLGSPTAEVTWGLILDLGLPNPSEDRALCEGRCQNTSGLGIHGKSPGIIGHAQFWVRGATVCRRLR